MARFPASRATTSSTKAPAPAAPSVPPAAAEWEWAGSPITPPTSGRATIQRKIEKGWITKGETLADLATKLGMKELEATLTKYNENARKGVDPDFSRRNGLVAIETAPFYGVAIYPTMYNTQGGPKRNAKCQIVDSSDQPIPRLYFAGELGSFWGWMYNGGGNNAECLCTGQIAARNVVTLEPLA